MIKIGPDLIYEDEKMMDDFLINDSSGLNEDNAAVVPTTAAPHQDVATAVPTITPTTSGNDMTGVQEDDLYNHQDQYDDDDP